VVESWAFHVAMARWTAGDICEAFGELGSMQTETPSAPPLPL
jgi:hypothetical protein